MQDRFLMAPAVPGCLKSMKMEIMTEEFKTGRKRDADEVFE